MALPLISVRWLLEYDCECYCYAANHESYSLLTDKNYDIKCHNHLY